MFRTVCYLVLVCTPVLHANNVEVHFRFEFIAEPPDVATGLLGGMTDWGLPPEGFYLVFDDTDQDNIWRGSMTLEEDVYTYKFVSLSSTEPDVDSSYPDVTGWFPDPLNPETDGSAYNNSVLQVTDPMLYYLLPMNGSDVEEQRPTISVNVAAGFETGLDLPSLQMLLDGNDVTGDAVFDSAIGYLAYVPTTDLSLGTHTVETSISNLEGTTATAISSFAVIQGPPRMDVRFVLDTHSPNFHLPVDVDRVQVAGDFNGWTPSPERLRDDDDNGVWEGSIRFAIGESFGYRFVVSGLHTPDPDNPELELRAPGDWWVSVGRANPNGTPRILDLAPVQGLVIMPDQPGPSVAFAAVPGDWGTSLEPDSMTVSVDGIPQPASPESSEDTLFVAVDLPSLEPGLHTVSIRVVDGIGRVSEGLFSFGAFAPGNGFHFIDAFGDDDGPGRYRYPEGVTSGAADLHAVHLGTSTRLSPTTFQTMVELEAVDMHTAVGLLICSSLDGQEEQIPGELEVLGPPWPGQGVFMWLVPPSSPFYDEATDNRLILGIDPFRVGAPIGINEDPEKTGTFIVSIPLEELEDHLGSYSGDWFYSAFAVLRREDGTELEPSQGGWLDLDDPDVYDVSFFPSASYQRRILGSWIAGGDPGGPREVTFNRSGRGILALPPDSIVGLPQPGPETQFFSAGARRIWKEFTVTGQVADPTATTGLFHHRRITWEIPIENGGFAVPIELHDGANFTGLTVEDAESNSSTTWARYDYLPDHRPKARIRVEPGTESVILDGTESWHPDGIELVSYHWFEEPGNPAGLDLSGVSSSIATFSLPKPTGEYAIRLVVSDGDCEGHAVATVLIDSTGAQQLSHDAHPSWAGEDLLYEIYPVAYSSSSDLDAIANDMERIQELGVGAIWLTPICVGNEVHGYAITDYFHVDQSLGGDTALSQLVAAAHAHGIKVILDLVINHTSIEHPFMRDAVRYGSNSIFYDYYLWRPDGTYESYWLDLPNLNYENPEVWGHFLEVSQYWLEQHHIDGYRCDVAWGIQERNPAFWQAWRDSLKVINDNVLLLAEASIDDVSLFDGRFDAAYDWSLLGLLRDLLRNQEPPAAVHQYLLQVPGFGDNPLALRFIENHDETRFIAEFGPDRTRLAAALLYTVPGLPLLYAGQEVGELSQRYYINWSDPEGMHSLYRTLGMLRSSLHCLREGSYWWIPNDHSTAVYSFSRETDEQRVIVAANCRALFETVTLNLPVDRWGFEEGETWVVSNLFTGESSEHLTEELESFSYDLGPYEFLVAAVADSVVANVLPFPDIPQLSLALLPPAPNPASGPVSLSFVLPANARTGLELYDLSGHKRMTILDERDMSQGKHQITWNPSLRKSLEPGAYFLVLRVEERAETKPIIVLR